MKKKTLEILLIVLFVVVLGNDVFAFGKNYYSYCVYEFTSASGKKINMNVFSKTNNHKLCKDTAASNPKRQGEWVLLGSDCVSGNDYDSNFAAVFNNQPIMGVYLSYRNLDGLETRITFVGVAGNDSPVPGYPIDLKTEQIMPVVSNMKSSLESAGINNVRIVYPKSN